MRQFVIMTTVLSLYALNKTAKKQNKKWGLKLDASEEEEFEEIEDAGAVCDTDALSGPFQQLSEGSDVLYDQQVKNFLTDISYQYPEDLPLWAVPTIIEFAGFFVPDYAQCTESWGMTLDEFATMACMLDGQIEAHPDMEAAIYFSLIDTCNTCTLNQYEVSFALDFFFEVSPEEAMMILEYLGGFAGEDEELSFDEFKSACEAEGTKMNLKHKLFKGKKQAQKKRQLVKSLKFLKKHVKTLRK